MKWLTADLADLTGRRGLPAALILVVAHVVGPLLAVPLWALGLLPVFNDMRWIPVAIVSIYCAVIYFGLFWRFGFWGAAASMGIGGGEKYMETFSPRTGLALGWLRFFMQLIAAGLIILPLIMTWTNTRWWHLTGTEKLDALPEQAAAIPVPDEWQLDRTRASQTGFPEVAFSTQFDGSEPQGFVEQTFEVPGTYTLDDLEQWLQDPVWDSFPDKGGPFGDLTLEECNSQSTRCTARFVPRSGGEPEYFVAADLDRLVSSYSGAELEVRLEYHKYEAPDWEVSQETVDRAHAIPVPSEWFRYDSGAATSGVGEEFAQSYRVPASFDREDLEAWLRGSAWTDPASGSPFGKIRVDDCREVGVDDNYLCTAIVVGTENTLENSSYDGPIESLSASLDSDHTVRVELERNG
ncbi:hypothetical protein [Arthrobacter castelli]|uniref:hypothetical protein n=1 Tax=Arthrobacter castelli TaxID=271431 RepID=UPI0003F4F4ED|nr:hypothetical protein [Arthrobacter castelli]